MYGKLWIESVVIISIFWRVYKDYWLLVFCVKYQKVAFLAGVRFWSLSVLKLMLTSHHELFPLSDN